MDRGKIKKGYEERAKLFAGQAKTIAKRLTILSLLRLVCFFTGILVIYHLYFIDLYWMALSAIFFIAFFIYLVKAYSANAYKKKYMLSLLKINQQEIEALEGRYPAFSEGEEYKGPDHFYSFDLDIFGEGSLFHCINRTCSLSGKGKLSKWLSNPLQTKAEIYQKQEAVEDLAGKLQWRQDFQATGGQSDEKPEDMRIVQEWLDEPSLFLKNVFYGYARVIMPIITCSLLFLNIFGIVPFSALVTAIIAQLAILGVKIRNVSYIHAKVSERLEMIKKYAGLLYLIEKEEFQPEYMRMLKARLLVNGKNAGASIHGLANIVNRFDYRLNIMAGFFLNAFFLWDIQCVFALEKWKRVYKSHIRDWFDVIGEVDALSSFACFKYNYPENVFPQVEENAGPVLLATQAGHPLIDEKVRVNNDFSVDAFGQIAIITGANMAGKSTFLRTIGVNLVLAMAGAPVCAKEFRFSVMGLFTGMRTSDSLQKNESYFYAELFRLKQLIEKIKSGERVFFILDEILKGTNSQDKLAGSRAFLEQVMRNNGTGLVATHDLKLTELENLYPANIKNLCFEIEIDGDQIFFDYLLKKGVTQKMNASFLMKQMGIVAD